MDSDAQDKIWHKILEKIKLQTSAANFRTWFSQAVLGQIDKYSITLIVPSAFIKGQLSARYEQLVSESAEGVLGRRLTINYEINPSKFTKPELLEEDLFDLPAIINHQPVSILNTKYTLESFVVGLTNNLAYAAAQAVVQNPGISYNPLYIYGQSGVGKTHLMQAIGNALIKKNPFLKIVYAPSERFMNDFIDSIRNKSTGDFRQKYRQADVLLIDDVQFISGKDSTQEEFFHTYNDLHTKNSQLIFTSDRPPNEIQKLESRLQSRLQGGLMVDIQLPDFETRMAILKAKLNERSEQMPEEVLQLIAQTVQSNTRELEGKLIQVLQSAKLQGQKVTLELAQKYLGQQTKPSQKFDQKKVLSFVMGYFNIKASDLIGPRRQKELVLPRQVAMYILYQDCGLPFEKIGEVLGGRDHTTIMHGVDKIKNLVLRDRELQKIMIEIRQQLIH